MKELYKEFRPQSLKAIAGNQSTKDALTNMIAKDTVPQTLLFFGPSGCGKTTIARILKMELECNDMDYREMNCSTDRGIDAIREITRTVGLSKFGAGRAFGRATLQRGRTGRRQMKRRLSLRRRRGASINSQKVQARLKGLG